MWLLVTSTVLPGLDREAIFLIALPYISGAVPKAWGFWLANGEFTFIGPRHVNFIDGSICAFAPADGVWAEGGDLRSLIDLYSVWAARHLFLEVFGRWPGKQYALCGASQYAQAHYRLHECKDDEFCGCGSETMRYDECCKPIDQKLDFETRAVEFLRSARGGFTSRRPSTEVVDFIEGRAAIPEIKTVHIQLNGVI